MTRFDIPSRYGYVDFGLRVRITVALIFLDWLMENVGPRHDGWVEKWDDDKDVVYIEITSDSDATAFKLMFVELLRKDGND